MLTLEQVSILIQTIAVLSGGAYFIWSIKASVATVVTEQIAIKEKLNKMDNSIDRLSTAAIELARQDERLNAIDVRMQEFSNKLSACIHPKTKRRA